MIRPRCRGIFSPKSRVRFPPASPVQFLIELMQCDKRSRNLPRKNVALFQQIVQVHFSKSFAQFVVVRGITARRALIGTWRTYFNRVTLSNCCCTFTIIFLMKYLINLSSGMVKNQRRKPIPWGSE